MSHDLNRTMLRMRRLVSRGGAAAYTDGQLLESFVARRDELAFGELVDRHGPMVWGVCRRLVRDRADADDAFQAAFLVLVRKAASIRERELVGNWLYGVACRVGLKLRGQRSRQRAREQPMNEMSHPPAPAPDRWAELEPILDEELSQLPDRYRAPLVLCELEGRTRREVARLLHLSDGTLTNRLTAARRMLARRLTRRGITLAGGALAALIAGQSAAAAMPAPLAGATVSVGLAAAGGKALAGLASGQAISLMEGVLKAMLMTKIKLSFAGALVSGVMTYALVGGSFAQDGPARPDAAPRGGARQAAGQAPQTDPERRPDHTAAAAPRDPEPARKRTDLLAGLPVAQDERDQLLPAIERLQKQLDELAKRVSALDAASRSATRGGGSDALPRTTPPRYGPPATASPLPALPATPPAPAAPRPGEPHRKPTQPRYQPPATPQPTPGPPAVPVPARRAEAGPIPPAAPAVNPRDQTPAARLDRIEQTLDQLKRDNAKVATELRELRDLIRAAIPQRRSELSPPLPNLPPTIAPATN